jgi:hypothetical protein
MLKETPMEETKENPVEKGLRIAFEEATSNETLNDNLEINRKNNVCVPSLQNGKCWCGKHINSDISPSDKTWGADFSPKDITMQIMKAIEVADISDFHGKNVFEASSYDEIFDLILHAFTSATIKAKEKYKEAILGEIDGMFDGYMGVETITINELEGIMKKHLKEPSK